MTGSRNQAGDSGNSSDLPSAAPEGDDGWPSFEDALFAHGFDVTPPTLPSREATPENVAAGDDDADAPVLSDAASAAPAGAGIDEPPTEERWWLEPSETQARVVAPAADEWDLPGDPVTPVPDVVAATESDAPEPAMAEALAPGGTVEHGWPDESTWEAAEVPDATPSTSASTTWPSDETWASDDSATQYTQPAPAGFAAQAPTTLPDLRPPTPPASLFARLGAGRTTPEAVPPQRAAIRPAAEVPDVDAGSGSHGAATTVGDRAFAPWAFEPPIVPDDASPSTAAPGADFWGEPNSPTDGPQTEPAGEQAAAVDENWASPGFAADDPASPFEQQYPFGADTPAPYDPSPQPSGGPGVDWYEAAALEVVGTSIPETANTEFIGYEDRVNAEPAAEQATPSAGAETTPDESVIEDPWASPAFLERLAGEGQDPATYELAPHDDGTEPVQTAEAADGSGSAETESAADAGVATEPEPEPEVSAPEPEVPEHDAWAGIGEDAWPVLSNEGWPQSTAEGWPAASTADTWSIGTSAAATPASRAIEQAPAETDSTAEDQASTEAPPEEPQAATDAAEAVAEPAESASRGPGPDATAVEAATAEPGTEAVADEAESAAAEAAVPAAEAAVPVADVEAAAPETDVSTPSAAADAEVATGPTEVATGPTEVDASATEPSIVAGEADAATAETDSTDRETAAPATDAPAPPVPTDASPGVEADAAAPAPVPLTKTKSRAKAKAAPTPAPEQGLFSRYAAAAEPTAPDASTANATPTVAASKVGTAESDLWKLVDDPSAAASVPGASEKRSFDPVSIFLTVLVALVIIALVVGFVVFASH